MKFLIELSRWDLWAITGVRAGFFDRHSTSAGRPKTRIGLLDTGTTFMDIDSTLCIIWSTRGWVTSPAIIDRSIESHLMCRGLFRDRKILHRDISTGNYLWNEMNSVPAEDDASVFICHLLDPKYVALQPWVGHDHIREPKHKSSIALIDVDHAAVYISKKRVMDTVVSFIFFSIFFECNKRPGQSYFFGSCNRERRPAGKTWYILPIHRAARRCCICI